ncbi:MAG: flagellar assembly peptidoglycan hydrolase FlgJ [Pseudomonadota bacterium]|mgnify:CR=1 FL=1
MINSYDTSNKLAIDTKSISDIRFKAKHNADQALRDTAQQFEALFLNMLLKSMREALPKNGLFDSQQTQFYTQLMDQQLAQSMSSKGNGIGIADMMVKQLTRINSSPEQLESNISQTEGILSSLNLNNNLLAVPAGHPNDISSQLWSGASALNNSDKTLFEAFNIEFKELDSATQINSSSPQPQNHKSNDFINTLLPHAKLASQSTGIPPHFMLAQAALESGWGKHEIRYADKSPSFNLFGIKAGENWKGNSIEVVTTEYINGVPQKMIEKFRAYNSYAEGFHDYAKLLLNNPRYAEVLNAQDAKTFATGLQRAGYATDPAYADKLIRILNSTALNKETI